MKMKMKDTRALSQQAKTYLQILMDPGDDEAALRTLPPLALHKEARLS